MGAGSKRPMPVSLARLVRRQAAGIIARLLRADGRRRGGASIKTLTLASGVAAKKATHAVVCEALKHVPLIKLLIEDAGIPVRADDIPKQGDGAIRPRGEGDAEVGPRCKLDPGLKALGFNP